MSETATNVTSCIYVAQHFLPEALDRLEALQAENERLQEQTEEYLEELRNVYQQRDKARAELAKAAQQETPQ